MMQESLDQLPELKLNHLNQMTDDTGMLQHAMFTIPNRREGYAGEVSARLQAYRLTGDSRWRGEAWPSFNWLLGDHDPQLPLYDSVTGGCWDGPQPDRANENQGAESTLSFSMALLEMRSLQEPESVAIPS